MAAQVWPLIASDELLKREEESLERELKWLLELLQDNLGSLKSALQECLALLAAEEPGTTLAISSHRSESVKGIVTRVGTRLTKGELTIRLSTLPPNNASGATALSINDPLPLPQLQTLSTLLNHALDILDISAYTGDPQNSGFISSQLKLLADTIDEAQTVLEGGDDVPGGGGRWYDDPRHEGSEVATGAGASTSRDHSHYDHSIHPPALLQTLSLHFSIASTALNLHIRTLAPSSSPVPSPHPGISRSPSPLSSFRPTATTGGTATPSTSASTPSNSAAGSGGGGGFAAALRTRLPFFGPRLAPHDEQDAVFTYRGRVVSVREKVRVESQDPGLLAIGAKLGVVRREVEGWRVRVMVVVSGGVPPSDDGDEGRGQD